MEFPLKKCQLSDQSDQTKPILKTLHLECRINYLSSPGSAVKHHLGVKLHVALLDCETPMHHGSETDAGNWRQMQLIWPKRASWWVRGTEFSHIWRSLTVQCSGSKGKVFKLHLHATGSRWRHLSMGWCEAICVTYWAVLQQQSGGPAADQQQTYEVRKTVRKHESVMR